MAETTAQVAREVVATCGPGRILNVSCGGGPLLADILRLGGNAYGLDLGNEMGSLAQRIATGRLYGGSIFQLPFADESFDMVVCSDALEILAPDKVPLALLELRRVCRRNLYLYLSPEGLAAGRAAGDTRGRDWWENAGLSTGFRKHPRYYALVPYASVERELSIRIPLEKIPEGPLSRHSLDSLLAQRDLHMDMSRETGRRSDAHMSRYQLVAGFVRDGDTVLDAACGMGYGSYLLASHGAAAKVIGADLDEGAVRYASDVFGGHDRLSFQVADVQHLSFLADNTVDLFVSFETLEHVPDPGRLIAEARRVLRPSGRFIVSVPNLWVDEHGNDPNPHHLHVYDWKRLAAETRTQFLLETAYVQIAGGGMKLHDHARMMAEFDPEGKLPEVAEWYIVVGMKDPVGCGQVPYDETALHWLSEPPNVAAFARDYENPWLVRGMVSIGWRMRSRLRRVEMAERALSESSPGSSDTGAALCVLSYCLLDVPGGPTTDAVRSIITRIDAYISLADSGPQSRRWAISLMYVQGLLWQAVGEFAKAMQSFRDCAAIDPLVYSPLIATKTVDACRLAGTLAFQAGNAEDARDSWRLAISLAERALAGDWREIRGDVEHPLTFGLQEASAVLRAASRCADGLHHLKTRPAGCGLSDDRRIDPVPNDRLRSLEEAARELAELRLSPYLRLQRAIENDPRSMRRWVRIGYLMTVILMPQRAKKRLQPVANLLRQRFVGRNS